MTILVLIILGVVAYALIKAFATTKSGNVSSSRPARPAATSTKHDWLEERWAMARQQGSPGGIFPAWFYEPITEFQIARLNEDGQRFDPRITKGQASDLIGLKEPADEDDLEILRFFKQPLRGMNESRARHMLAILFQDPANKLAWEARPASKRTAEFFRFVGTKLPAGTTEREAQEMAKARLEELTKSDGQLLSEWNSYERVLDDLDDPEFREGYDLKKPSYKQVREVMDMLRNEGKSWDEVADDVDAVAERLLEVFPNLSR